MELSVEDKNRKEERFGKSSSRWNAILATGFTHTVSTPSCVTSQQRDHGCFVKKVDGWFSFRKTFLRMIPSVPYKIKYTSRYSHNLYACIFPRKQKSKAVIDSSTELTVDSTHTQLHNNI